MPISTDFSFNGENSTDYGLSIIRIDTGLPNTPLFGNRQIVEEKIPGRDNPYLYRLDKSPIEFAAYCSLLDEEFTEEKKADLFHWLIHSDYKTFQTTDYMGKYFYVIFDQDSVLSLDGNNYGYFPLHCRTNAWHAWSTIYSDEYDCSGNSLAATPTTTTTIRPENQSNILSWYYPEIEVELQDDETGFSLVNTSDSNSTLTFSGLSTGETIYINNKMKRIISDTDLNRYSNHNGTWHRWKYGVNNITVKGKVIINTRAQFPLII